MKGHLDPEVLAEYRAGLVTGRRSRAIDAHLAVCAECTAVDGRLAEVSTLLAAAPVPAVPDAVARRLESALAAASASSASSASSVENPIQNERDSVPPPRHSRVSKAGWFGGFSSRALTPLAGALAVLVVLGGAGYGLSLLTGGSSSSSSPTSAGAAEPNAGTAGGARAAVSGAGSAGSMPSNGKLHASALGPIMIVHSDVNYQPATLHELTGQIYGAFGTAVPQKAAAAARPASPTQAGCVLRLTGGQLPAEAISARYQGAPVTIVVVRRAAGGGELALVAGSGCSATVSDILARVVLR
jgi:hypothetical protein